MHRPSYSAHKDLELERHRKVCLHRVGDVFKSSNADVEECTNDANATVAEHLAENPVSHHLIDANQRILEDANNLDERKQFAVGIPKTLQGESDLGQCILRFLGRRRETH